MEVRRHANDASPALQEPRRQRNPHPEFPLRIRLLLTPLLFANLLPKRPGILAYSLSSSDHPFCGRSIRLLYQFWPIHFLPEALR